MKIRTDFVTNSSSSCYVAVVIETTDGRQYCGAFVGDEIGMFTGGISMVKDFSIRGICSATNGKEVLKVIDAAYDGLFSHFEDLDSLFEEDDTGSVKTVLMNNGVCGKIGGQSEVEKLAIQDIGKVEIREEYRGFGAETKSSLTVDLNKREEFIEISKGSQSMTHGVLRNWETGEETRF